MTSETLAAVMEPTILAAIHAEFGTEIAFDPDRLQAQAARLASAIAQGVANGLVPYLQSPATQVVGPGTPPPVIGSLA